MTQANLMLIYSISYIVFFALLLLSKKKKGIRLMEQNGPVTNKAMLIVLHIGGVLLFTLISFCSFNHQWQDIVFGKKAVSDLQALTTSFFIILIIIIAPVLAEKNYRSVKNSTAANPSFSTGFITNYFFVRMLFLAAYEIWFRGYFLTDCIAGWGVLFAVLINIFFYTLLHIVNGKNEMLACIPFGLLLCSLSVWTGAAWPAILLHITLTVSYEVHLIKKITQSSISFV